MTKRLLKDALLDLMEHQDLVSISVTAICKTADVHRSTFYKYYTDPSDLLREVEQDFLDRIPSPPRIIDQRNQKALLAATSEFFDFIKENGYVPVGNSADELTSGFIRTYIANGTVGMMREWVNTDFRISSQDLAEMMYFLSREISQY